jgi:hypothetical protein
MIKAAASTNDIPAGILLRVIRQESRFKPDAVGPVTRSGTHALGIAQFMPATAAERRLNSPFDPAEALPKAAEFLHDLHAEFGNIGLAAAADNAGAQRVRDWLAGRRTLPGETKAYVRIVTGRDVGEWARSQPPQITDTMANDVPCADIARLELSAAPSTTVRKTRITGTQPAANHRTWVAQLIGEESELKALDRYAQLKRKHPAILGGFEPRYYIIRLGEALQRPGTGSDSQGHPPGRGIIVYTSAVLRRARRAMLGPTGLFQIAIGECTTTGFVYIRSALACLRPPSVRARISSRAAGGRVFLICVTHDFPRSAWPGGGSRASGDPRSPGVDAPFSWPLSLLCRQLDQAYGISFDISWCPRHIQALGPALAVPFSPRPKQPLPHQRGHRSSNEQRPAYGGRLRIERHYLGERSRLAPRRAGLSWRDGEALQRQRIPAQPEPDLRTAIEAAHVGDEGVDRSRKRADLRARRVPRKGSRRAAHRGDPYATARHEAHIASSARNYRLSLRYCLFRARLSESEIQASAAALFHLIEGARHKLGIVIECCGPCWRERTRLFVGTTVYTCRIIRTKARAIVKGCMTTAVTRPIVLSGS